MRRLLFLTLLLSLLSNTGCYYSHLASGQLKMLWSRRAIDAAIDDPETSPQTADLLRFVGEARSFAAELGLDVGDQYTSYVDWPGDRIVTTLVRARPDSVEAVPFRFPVLGELPYKGYFDRQRAEREAARLREEEAFDVCISGVTAYSTLGWIDDPVTSPMLRRGPAALVETILHELVHATVFFKEEVDFNESVAQFIGQEAAIRFFDRAPPSWVGGSDVEWPSASRVRDGVKDRRDLGEAVSRFRTRLADFFEATTRGDEAAGAAPDPEALDALRAAGRQQLAALPLRVFNVEKMATRTRLSNACLALRGAYVADRPKHEKVLAALGGDLRAMVEHLRRTEADGLGPEAFYAVGDAI